MGKINDRYKMEIEQSVLLNGDPLDNYHIVDDSIVIKPRSYLRPEVSEADKKIILQELSEDLSHYGLEVINLDEKLIRVQADSFELDIPKTLVIPYDDAIFAEILKYQQLHFSNRASR